MPTQSASVFPWVGNLLQFALTEENLQRLYRALKLVEGYVTPAEGDAQDTEHAADAV